MRSVFILYHTHGDDEEAREVNEKMIGVYSDRENAEAAKARKLQYPGFCETPEGFEIEEIEVNVDLWSEGYITVPIR